MKTGDDFLNDFSKLLKSYCIEKHGVTLDEFLNEEKYLKQKKIETLRKEFINYLLDDDDE